MNTKIKLFGIVLVGLALTFSSCRRRNVLPDYSTDFATASSDNARVGDGLDDQDNDVSLMTDATPSMSGRQMSGAFNPLCNATVVYDTLSNPKTVTITYNGLNCNGTRTREGVVVLSLPLGVHFKDAGAVLTVTATHLKITRVSDGKYIIINGSRQITNVSGGLVRDLATLGTITHEITSGGITVTFDDNTTRVWQVAKYRVFTYDNGVVATTTGAATEGGFANVAEWGTVRNGQLFYAQITAPMVVRQDCDWRLVSGQKMFHKMQRDVTVTFGLDANGNATSCPAAGASYYMKAEWTDAHGDAHSVIRPY